MRVRQRPLSSFLALLAVGGLGSAAALGGAAALGELHLPSLAGGAERPAPVRLALTRARALSVGEIERRDAPGVVLLAAGSSRARSLGSGFVLDSRGDIVTSDRALLGAGAALRVIFSGGHSHPAQVLGRDAASDLAVLRVEVPPSALVPLPLGSSANVRVGDRVVVIAGPVHGARAVTTATVKGLAALIRTDAAVRSSGAPLIDARGEVIGISAGGPGSARPGCAIPSSTVRRVVAGILRNA